MLSPNDRPLTALRWAAWIVIPLAGTAWLLTDLGRYYIAYDEWGLVNRVVAGDWAREMLVGFNGHFVFFDYWAYHVQVNLFGVESATFIYLTLCASLLALHLAAAAFLWRAGLPAAVALLAAGLVTYFGPGAESMVYTIMQFWNVSLAFIALAGFFALQQEFGRSTAVVVALALVGAVLGDSGVGLVGIAFVGCLLVFLVPRALVATAVVPPFVVWLLWTVLDETGALATRACTGFSGGNCDNVRFSATPGDTVEFAAHLLFRAAGGLVGGFFLAGVVALIAAGTWVGSFAISRGLPRRAVACLAAGLGAAVALAGSIAWSRTGFWPTVEESVATLLGPSNRYLQPIAFFLLLGIAPAVAATFAASSLAVRRAGTAVAATGCVVVFALNLDRIEPTQTFYEGWGDGVENEVRAAVQVLEQGCPSGSVPDPQAQPITQSPQITVALLEELLDRGALTPAFGRPPPAAVVDAICGPDEGG